VGGEEEEFGGDVEIGSGGGEVVVGEGLWIGDHERPGLGLPGVRGLVFRRGVGGEEGIEEGA
jgi:hypothetical protein